ncbi:hypothetical protein AB0A70_04840 [Streptomyces morookaense]|uniref:terpene synthase family protein n=1 Tax=Streptomyces morookaense TaxID=1970 RepID=UPI0033D9D7D6
MPMIDLSVLVDGFYDPPCPMVNPAAAQAEDEVIAWLWRLGFLTSEAQERHLRSFKFGLYHGISTPTVGLQQLVLGIQWFCWGSLSDDQYDNYDWGEREERMRRVLRDMRAIATKGPEGLQGTQDNPVIAGFADLWPRLTAGLPPRARQRITGHFLDYMQAIVLQNRYHAKGRVPDAATFVTMRRNTIAMLFQVDVLEIVSRIRIPDALRDSLLFRELALCFADILAWHNDVYGLEKDIADGQTCNVVRVVAASEGCTLAEAVARVLDRAKQRQQIFLDIEEQLPGLADSLGLPPEAAAEAARLATDLRAYAFADLVWIRETRRYDLELPRIKGTFDDVLITH